MKLLHDLLSILPQGKVIHVRIGLHWTAVVVEVAGETRCGLSSTLRPRDRHGGAPSVPKAGRLENISGWDLAALSLEEDHPTMAAVGVAAINALLPPPPQDAWEEINAEQVIAEQGADKSVVIIGHFPFISRLRSRVGELMVLDLQPREGDLPAEIAPQVIPQAEVVAITAMAISNHTMQDLLEMCSSKALVMIVGPSTPMSEVLFGHGADMLCGSVVTDLEAVLQAVGQGANFRQIHKAGVRLITVKRPGFSTSV